MHAAAAVGSKLAPRPRCCTPRACGRRTSTHSGGRTLPAAPTGRPSCGGCPTAKATCRAAASRCCGWSHRISPGARCAPSNAWQGRSPRPETPAGPTPQAVRTAASGSGGCSRPESERELTRILLEPAGVAVRPQDFRYRTAAKVWAATQDIQAVKATLFHRQAETSAIYVARGMPPETRRDTDPLSGVFESAERHGSPRAATNHKDR